MRIVFQREGGIAYFPGLSKPITVDTATLPSSEGAKLEELVHAAGFFTRPATTAVPSSGAADYQTYTISVEEAGQSHTIQAIEPIEDSALQALIDGLRALQQKDSA